MTELETLRQEIDRVDGAIVPLLLERFEIVRRIGEVKKEAGLPVYNAAREEAVLDKVSALAPDAATANALRVVYAQVMAAAKELEK